MKRATWLLGWQVLCLTVCALPARAADTITMGTLLDEMVNRSRLARLPEPSYTCKQSSSYDRGSTSPKKIETWFANMDRSEFLRMEERDGRKEFVMLDANGPGAVVRFWATWHGPGGGESVGASADAELVRLAVVPGAVDHMLVGPGVLAAAMLPDPKPVRTTAGGVQLAGNLVEIDVVAYVGPTPATR